MAVAIPAGATVGKHYLIANADDDDVLDESKENNNALARQVLIGPDLLDLVVHIARGRRGGRDDFRHRHREESGRWRRRRFDHEVLPVDE